jgi:hypothetical protein
MKQAAKVVVKILLDPPKTISAIAYIIFCRLSENDWVVYERMVEEREE